MVDRFGVHRLHDAQVIGDLGQMRKSVADPRAALTVLLELKRTAGQWLAGLADVADGCGLGTDLRHDVCDGGP